MLRLMREPTTHWSCRCFQEEKISLDPVLSAINLTVDQPQAVNAQQRPEGPFTGPFWTTSRGGAVPQNTTKFCPHHRRHSELQAGSLTASNGTLGFNTSPCYLWGIQQFHPRLLPHWAWATAKLSRTCPITKELSCFKTEPQPKKAPLPKPSPHQLLSCY